MRTVVSATKAGRIARRASAAALAAAALLAGQATAPAGASAPVPGGTAGAAGRMPAPKSAAMAALRRAHGLGELPRAHGVPGHFVSRRVSARPLLPPRLRRAPAPVFPAPGTVTLAVPKYAQPGMAPAWSKAGAVPVQVSAPGSARTAAAAGQVSQVRVTVASRATSLAAGADGVLLAVSRADAGAAAGRVRVRVSYAGFASAFGGDFGQRLALFELPACALTTPRAGECQTATPVSAVNDGTARTLTATVAVAPAGAAPVVLSAQSTTSGGTGDYRATSLSPASSWQVGLQSGDFTYSYPLRAPPPIGGAAPSLSLGYDSQATDGETAQSNSQPGQLGEGFSLAGGGFIERRYASCADHVGDAGNNTGQAKKTGDQCWDGSNAYLSLGGHSGQIILDTGGSWHLASDDGSVVKEISGGTSNGAYNNSHWEIITPDGTQYWFGLNQLPGYGAGDQATSSAWTEPVVGLHSGDPCNTSGSYASSVCTNMAWRWNLDLVVDPNGNATSYYYSPQTSYYAFGSYSDSTGEHQGSRWLKYTTGGMLTDIYYGSQVTPSATPGTAPGGNLYANRPFHVALFYRDRCTVLDSKGNPDTTTCNANTSSATDWPDTPWDLYCGSSTGSGCSGTQHDSPSFFDTQMLMWVITYVYEGSSPYQEVDNYRLAYQWLPGDSGNNDLALYSITHSGQVDGSAYTPPVTFPGWAALGSKPYSDGYPQVIRNRLTEIVSETGAQTNVSYNPASCAPSPPSDPSSNTYPCFPQIWTSGTIGAGTVTSWFSKYTVSQVKVTDTSPYGSPPLVTSYYYCAPDGTNCPSGSSGHGAAWHYDTDIDLVKAKDKSWDQWRGYRYVREVTGDSSGTQSEADYTFVRGMDGDPVKDSSGNWITRSVSFAPSDVTGTTQSPASITDSNALNGFQAEKITYDGLNTAAQVSDEVSWPWMPASPTSTSAAQPWGQPLTAWPTGTAETDTYTPLAAGGTRQTQVTSTFSSANGLLLTSEDHGDLSQPSQALCTTYSYPSPASAAGLIDYLTEVKATACGTSGSPQVSDTQYFYDGKGLGAAPTKGNVTKTQQWSSGDPGVTAHEDIVSRNGYDSFGRLTCSENALGSDATCTPGHAYTTSYTYSSTWGSGNPTTKVTVKSPLTTTTFATTTSDLNPAWSLPKDKIDASGQVTDYVYDPLGRVTCAWLPSQAGSTSSCTGTPGYQFSYLVLATAPSSVTTQRLVASTSGNTSYNTTVQLYDSLLRPRQVQASSDASGVGTEVTDTFYDSRGNISISNGPYAGGSAAPSTSLWQTTEPQVPDETAYTYDGAGRRTEADFSSYGTLKWKTTWSYPGSDAVTVIPPTGGTIATTYTDARGRVTQIDQYHSKTSASGAYDATAYAYAYISGGSTKTVTDAGGNAWRWTSDLLGRVVSATDPDTGTTASTWDDLGQLTSRTDQAGKTTSWAYDAAGRRTAEYAAATGSQSAGNQLAAWTYDTATLDNPSQPGATTAVGQVASATSYVGGTGGEKYQADYSKYSPFYTPETVTYTIPSNSVTGSLAGSYQYGYTYNPDGTVASVAYPGGGGLSAETVLNSYDGLGYFTGNGSSASNYVAAEYYTSDGQPQEIDLTAAQSASWSRLKYTYDPATLRLATSTVARQSTSYAPDTSTQYAYDASGNVLSANDSVTGDNQCYAYDYLARLTAAWSQAAACPASPSTPPGASGIGGPAPYQQTLAYDNGGTASGSANGTTGNITDSTLITGSGTSATTTDVSYASQYPAYGASQPHAPAGYTTTTSGNAVATSQTWTPDGQLASATSGGNTTSYNWNGTGMTPGQLATITSGSTISTYRYDASGNLLVRQDGTTSTLYLPGQELSASGSTVTATRYYTANGQVVAARTTSALSWLSSDPHGTATVAIDSSSQAVAWRYYTPFGQFRPPVTGTWPGTRRFVGGTYDSTTGLTNLGAREYNPATPSFVSPDPILNPYDPQNLNPYDYAANNPATGSDPSGLHVLNDPSDTTDPTITYKIDNGQGFYNPADYNAYIASLGTTKDLLGGALNAAYHLSKSGVELWAFSMAGPAGSSAVDHFLPSNLALGNPNTVAYQTGGIYFNAAAFLIPGGIESDAARFADGILAKAPEAVGADNVMNGVRLAQQLTRQEASSVFTRSGELQQVVIDQSHEIINGARLGNKALVKELTSDGSSISDWGKYTTPTFRSPAGPFQVHFYYNSVTDEAFYGADYKAVFVGGSW